jgi:hypothetical protein
MGMKDIGTIGSGSQDFVKLKSGESVRLHVIDSDFYSFGQVYPEGSKRGFNVRPGQQVPGQAVREQHAVRAYDFATKSVKVWAFGAKVAKDIQKAHQEWGGSFDKFDIKLSREGSSQNDTRYFVIAVPTEFKDSLMEGVEIPDLDEALPFAKPDELAALSKGAAPAGVHKTAGRA